MASQYPPEGFRLASELSEAVESLDAALAQASRAVDDIRGSLSQITALAQVVQELEGAMALARQSLGIGAQAAHQEPRPATVTPIKPEQPVEPPRPAPAPTPEPAYEPPSAVEPEPEPQPEPEAIPTSEGPVSHKIRLSVTSKTGSLDLKAVDASVNENPAVVDVALLDYDGRRATLKLWVQDAADPVGVREALLGSLRRRLGGDEVAEVVADFEERPAA